MAKVESRKRGVHRHLWLAVCLGLSAPSASVIAQAADTATQELLRQQERERALREQQQTTPDVRLPAPTQNAPERLPANEAPCFPIQHIQLDGDDAQAFRWALKAADPSHDPATGRCLGTGGINAVMKRVQNAIVARGDTIDQASPQQHATGAAHAVALG